MEKVVLSDKGNRCLVYFNFWEDYDDIEKLADVICKNFKGSIKDKVDGPDARVWKLSIAKKEILLINDDPYGNYLRADTAPAIDVLKGMVPRFKEIFVDTENSKVQNSELN